MVPQFFSKFGQYSGSCGEVALSVVVLPHQVEHREIVGLRHDVLLQIRLQIRRLNLQHHSTILNSLIGGYLMAIFAVRALTACL